jgi:hypothetical protein
MCRCSRCKVVWYCGREHQKADFKAHKQFCKVFREMGSVGLDDELGVRNVLERLRGSKHTHTHTEGKEEEEEEEEGKEVAVVSGADLAKARKYHEVTVRRHHLRDAMRPKNPLEGKEGDANESEMMLMPQQQPNLTSDPSHGAGWTRWQDEVIIHEPRCQVCQVVSSRKPLTLCGGCGVVGHCDEHRDEFVAEHSKAVCAAYVRYTQCAQVTAEFQMMEADLVGVCICVCSLLCILISLTHTHTYTYPYIVYIYIYRCGFLTTRTILSVPRGLNP